MAVFAVSVCISSKWLALLYVLGCVVRNKTVGVVVVNIGTLLRTILSPESYTISLESDWIFEWSKWRNVVLSADFVFAFWSTTEIVDDATKLFSTASLVPNDRLASLLWGPSIMVAFTSIVSIDEVVWRFCWFESPMWLYVGDKVNIDWFDSWKIKMVDWLR